MFISKLNLTVDPVSRAMLFPSPRVITRRARSRVLLLRSQGCLCKISELRILEERQEAVARWISDRRQLPLGFPCRSRRRQRVKDGAMAPLISSSKRRLLLRLGGYQE